MELPVRGKKGGREDSWTWKEELQSVGATAEHNGNRVKWRQVICCGKPKRKQLNEEGIALWGECIYSYKHLVWFDYSVCHFPLCGDND